MEEQVLIQSRPQKVDEAGNRETTTAVIIMMKKNARHHVRTSERHLHHGQAGGATY